MIDLPRMMSEFAARDADFIEIRVYEDGWLAWLQDQGDSVLHCRGWEGYEIAMCTRRTFTGKHILIGYVFFMSPRARRCPMCVRMIDDLPVCDTPDYAAYTTRYSQPFDLVYARDPRRG